VREDVVGRTLAALEDAGALRQAPSSEAAASVPAQ
jgi:phosphate acyltransferase